MTSYPLIGYKPCDYGPDPNAPIYTGPTYESWTDREYVYGTNDVDEFILQINRSDNFVYMLYSRARVSLLRGSVISNIVWFPLVHVA